MIDKFLHAKHWQLFILIFGLPLLFQIIMMSIMVSNLISESNADLNVFFDVMKFIPILGVICIGLLFGWLWSIAIGLQQYMPSHLEIKTTRFKIFFFIPLVYITILLFFIGNVISGLSDNVGNINPESMTSIIGIIVPFHLLSMFGIFYCIYFCAKTIRTLETRDQVKFSDFAGEFFMLWFYFIGIWIIQPRINKIVEEKEEKLTV